MSDLRYTFAATKGSKGLVIEARPYFDRVVSTLGDGERFVLTLENFKDKRSSAQNRMAWGFTHRVSTSAGVGWSQLCHESRNSTCAGGYSPMTPTESLKLWDIEIRMERQAQQRKVRWFLVAMAIGAVSLWAVIEGVAWLAHWLGGAL